MAFKTDLMLVAGLAKALPAFTWSVNGTPNDLTGCTAKLMAKVQGDPTQPALVTLTTGGGGIVLGGAAGTIALSFTAAQTAVPGLDQSRYDLVIFYPGGNSTGDIVMEGIITVKTAVTNIP